MCFKSNVVEFVCNVFKYMHVGACIRVNVRLCFGSVSLVALMAVAMKQYEEMAVAIRQYEHMAVANSIRQYEDMHLVANEHFVCHAYEQTCGKGWNATQDMSTRCQRTSARLAR